MGRRHVDDADRQSFHGVKVLQPSLQGIGMVQEPYKGRGGIKGQKSAAHRPGSICMAVGREPPPLISVSSADLRRAVMSDTRGGGGGGHLISRMTI
jgi:hypothetical protein